MAILRAVLKFFLPAVIVVMVTLTVVMAALHNRNGLAGLAGVNVPIALGEIVAICIGYAAGLLLMRSHASLHSARRHWVGATLALIVFGVLSIFAQGSHLPFIVAACAVCGAIAAFAVWLPTRAAS